MINEDPTRVLRSLRYGDGSARVTGFGEGRTAARVRISWVQSIAARLCYR